MRKVLFITDGGKNGLVQTLKGAYDITSLKLDKVTVQEDLRPYNLLILDIWERPDGFIDLLVKKEPLAPVILIADKNLISLADFIGHGNIRGFIERPVNLAVMINMMEKCLKKTELGEHSLKMILLGEETAYLFHELNNLLTSILGNFEILSEEGGPERKTDHHQRLMKESLARACEMLREAQVFSKKSEIPLAINLKELFDSLLALMSKRINSHSIKVERDIEDIEIVGIPDAFKIIFMNLIKNALEASEKGGEIGISVRTNGKIEISVSDKGCGIPTDMLREIFDPFFTTKTGGTGIGLHLVKKMVEKLGGEIKVAPNGETGTRFSVDLPLSLLVEKECCFN